MFYMFLYIVNIYAKRFYRQEQIKAKELFYVIKYCHNKKNTFEK